MEKHKRTKETNENRYVLRQATYTPRWVWQEARAKAMAATKDEIDYKEVIEIKNKKRNNGENRKIIIKEEVFAIE